MRIALVHSRYAMLGGEDRAMALHEELLKANGHQVWTLTGDGRAIRESGIIGQLAAACRMAWAPGMAAAISHIIEQNNIQLVHVHNLYPTLSPSVIVAAKRLGIPVVMTLHNYRLRCPNALFLRSGRVCMRCARGNYLHAVCGRCRGSLMESATYAAILRIHRTFRLIERHVDAFISPSRFLADQMIRLGLPASRMHVIPNYVHNQAHGWEGGRRAAYIGRLSPEKGVGHLIAAFSFMPERELMIVGDGSQADLLKKQALKAGNISFTGYLPGSEAVADVLRQVAFVIVPSLAYENQPYSALEAMAAGVPLLVSNRGGLPELVQNGQNGFIFVAGDLSDLCGRLEAMWQADLSAMSREARLMYAERYTPQAHYRRLFALYSSLV